VLFEAQDGSVHTCLGGAFPQALAAHVEVLYAARLVEDRQVLLASRQLVQGKRSVVLDRADRAVEQPQQWW
jgi:hypothetical protein